MQYIYNLMVVVRTFQLVSISKLSAIMLGVAASVAAQTVVSVAPFRSIELHDGGHVILRHGETQSVTLLKGSMDCAQFAIADGDRLVIDKYKEQCPRKYEFEIEIITPSIAEILVADGGRIQSRDSFPRQAEIKTVVRNGGTIDIRTMVADSITASVEEGGRIFGMPRIALFANIIDGGQITYWGDARVESSVRHGGAVTKGTADEADKPLSELSLRESPLKCLENEK
jgi:hypothetical protein